MARTIDTIFLLGLIESVHDHMPIPTPPPVTLLLPKDPYLQKTDPVIVPRVEFDHTYLPTLPINLPTLIVGVGDPYTRVLRSAREILRGIDPMIVGSAPMGLESLGLLLIKERVHAAPKDSWKSSTQWYAQYNRRKDIRNYSQRSQTPVPATVVRRYN